MSSYLSEDKVLGFLANDESEEKEVSDADWISTDDGEKDREEISSEAEMDDQPCFSDSASYF